MVLTEVPAEEVEGPFQVRLRRPVQAVGPVRLGDGLPDGRLDQRLPVEPPLDHLGRPIQQRAQLQVAVGLVVGAGLGQQVLLQEVVDGLGDGRLFLGIRLGFGGPVALGLGLLALRLLRLAGLFLLVSLGQGRRLGVGRPHRLPGAECHTRHEQ